MSFCVIRHLIYSIKPGADPGFLEREFICINAAYKVWVVRFANFVSFFLNIP